MNRAEKIKINIKNGAQSIEMYEFNRTRKRFHLKRKFYLFESLHIRDHFISSNPRMIFPYHSVLPSRMFGD